MVSSLIGRAPEAWFSAGTDSPNDDSSWERSCLPVALRSLGWCASLLFQSELRLHVWLQAPGLFCPWGPEPTVGGGAESGQELVALLIGSVAFCSVFGLLAIQRLGPGRLPGGSTQTAAPPPWAPGPSWHLESLMLG